MSRRGRDRAFVVLLWMLALAIPLGASLAASYLLTQHNVALDLERLSSANARRVEAIFDQAAASLARLSQTSTGDCSEADLEALRQAVYSDLYFREAGLLRNGHLHCTSFHHYQPPIEIPAAYLSERAVFVDGAFEIWLPQPTLLGDQSLVVVHFLDRARLDYVNLLLNERQFVEGVKHFGEVQGLALLASTDAVFRLGSDGAASATWVPDALEPGIHSDQTHGVVAIAKAGRYPLYLLARMPAQAVRNQWAAESRPATLIGFALSLVAALLLSRRLPPEREAVRDLRLGLRGGEIVAYFQPLIDARSGRVLGAEALARWQHPQRGWVPPDVFAPLAERSGLIEALTLSVLAKVAEARRRLPRELRLAVNLSPSLLQDGSLERLLDEAFGATASLDGLVLEITERQLIEYTSGTAAASVARLAARGAKVSLDDFGTGYSGLSHLRHLTLHELKIDGSFVRALDTEAVTASLVDGIAAMAERLGLELVAEGVETAAQRDQLLARGIFIQQGWLYAKAMPLGEFVRFLASSEQASAAT
ncbi:MAG: EAL domain-containing protein [Pseudomarimonas sp.]